MGGEEEGDIGFHLGVCVVVTAWPKNKKCRWWVLVFINSLPLYVSTSLPILVFILILFFTSPRLLLATTVPVI